MIRRTVQLAVAVVVTVTASLVPFQGASASDGCGDGWYKESDGYLTKDGQWQGIGSHSAWIYHSGRVRFCTDNDPVNDDENRRALIGYTSDSYPFESWVDKFGSYTKFCVRQTIKAHMSGIKSSESWSVSGTVSKSDPEVSASYSATYDTLTVTVAKTGTCSASASSIRPRTSGIMLTADDDTGKVNWVQLTTTLTAEYWVNGTKYVDSHSLVENDYS